MKDNFRFDLVEHDHQRLYDKYFDVDHKKRVVNFEIDKEKFSDYFENENFGKRDFFSSTLTNELMEKVRLMPKGYKANIEISANKIDKDVKDMKESFIDAIKYSNLSQLRDRRLKWSFHAVTLVLGTLLLLINAILVTSGGWGTGTKEIFWSNFTTSLGSVFIWEAMISLLIHPQERNRTSLIALRKINQIIFTDGEHNVLAKIGKKEIISDFETETVFYRSTRTFTIITAVTLGGYALAQAILIITSNANEHFDFVSDYSIIFWASSLVLYSSFCAVVGYGLFQENKFFRYVSRLVFALGIVFAICSAIFAHNESHIGLKTSSIVLLALLTVFMFIILITDIRRLVKKNKN